jgi:aspartyl-tRNA(Asn)/glutamyl-tRNA(Gln) amidotransferase subunit A
VTAAELRRAYETRERSPVEVTRAHLARLEQVEPELNAFVTVTPELALEAAAAAEHAYANGTAGPLAGIPASIKDLVQLAGVRCTMGSARYAERVSSADDPLAARIRAAGAVILGKTTTPEYGWKGETTSPVTGSTVNPWRRGLTPGGSSGGAAAAAAAGVGIVHQGGDGAGSIRIPSSFSGVFGIKPTTGTVPQPTNSGLSSQGPIARTVDDAALLLEVMGEMHVRAGLDDGIDGLRAAWSGDLGFAAVDPAVRDLAEAAAVRFRELGCSVEERDPGLADPWPIVDVIWSWSQAQDEDERTVALSDPGRRPVIERGKALTEDDHTRAQDERRDYRARMEAFFDDVDLLLTPTLPVTAFPAGRDQPGEVAGRPTEYLSWTAFTYPFNVSGQPAASVPCGMLDGLPVGLQIVGRRGNDALVLRAARAFEQLQPWSYDGLDLVSPAG